jgi:hypothetical protein
MTAIKFARYRCVVGLLLLLTGWPVYAANLYSTEVGISEQSSAGREAAIRSALTQVLLRIGGTSAETLATNVKQPDRYILSYQYVRDADGGLRLQVTFDQRQVNQLLRQRNLAVWEGARPQTLVWLGVEDNGQRRILHAGEDDPVSKSLLNAGQRYALPLLLPTSTGQQLEYVDIVSADESRIQAAAQPYHADTNLLVNLYPRGEQWEARWILLADGKREEWRTGPDVLDAVIDTGLRQLSSAYVNSYLTQPDDNQVHHMLISIEGVNGLADYARAQNALSALDQVQAARLTQVQDDRLIMAADIKGSLERLRRAVQRNADLEIVTTQPAADAGADPALIRFKLQPGQP